jgi:hypothetical protein
MPALAEMEFICSRIDVCLISSMLLARGTVSFNKLIASAIQEIEVVTCLAFYSSAVYKLENTGTIAIVFMLL